MEVLIVLIPLALLLGGLFIGACLWAIIGGQYDDLDTPAQRILIDDLKQKNIASKSGEERA